MRSESPSHAPFTTGWDSAVIDALPVTIATIDRGGVILAVNAAWRRFALENSSEPGVRPRYTEPGVNYLTICDSAVGSSREGAAEAAAGIRAVLTGRQPIFTLEYPCHSPGQQRWFFMWVSPLDHADGGAVVSHIDITERWQAETIAHDSSLRLQLALEATGDGLWDWDLRSGLAYLSSGYYALSGYRPEDVHPDFEFFKRLIYPDDLGSVLSIMEAHLRGETPTSDQLPHAHGYRKHALDSRPRPGGRTGRDR